MSKDYASIYSYILGTEVEKWWGGKEWEKQRQKQKKFTQGSVTEKNHRAKKKWWKKILQSELHCRAYKLYPTEWHLGSHFNLYCSFNFLVLVASPFTWFSLQLGKGTFSLSRLTHFMCSIVIRTQVAKHPCRKTLMDNHGLKVIKKMCYKQLSSLIRLHLSKHRSWFHNWHV